MSAAPDEQNECSQCAGPAGGTSSSLELLLHLYKRVSACTIRLKNKKEIKEVDLISP